MLVVTHYIATSCTRASPPSPSSPLRPLPLLPAPPPPPASFFWWMAWRCPRSCGLCRRAVSPLQMILLPLAGLVDTAVLARLCKGDTTRSFRSGPVGWWICTCIYIYECTHSRAYIPASLCLSLLLVGLLAVGTVFPHLFVYMCPRLAS